ncbi:MAG: argininosuccinate synthase [Phycisphaerales bacterium]|nr:argininosuccinate synthase [Phycisphaerales bacterium]
MKKGTVILAFSGGLDTSYCVPALAERGFSVITLFVDTGGITEADAKAIERRALTLGAAQHLHVDAREELWSSFVVPFVMGGSLYQDQYPLLCSDRYVIAQNMASAAEAHDAVAIAHGCTAMGNDQVRFDVSLACLTDLPVLAPIRDVQAFTRTPRQYEIDALRNWGHDVDATVKRYTINRNLLGATISGSEIDRFEPPAHDARQMTAPPEAWPGAPTRCTIEFAQGVAVALDSVSMDGSAILAKLNAMFGSHGVGRGIYTGDTVIGLKGRIVYEAPGLTALLCAHRALDELVLSRAQARAKPGIARQWTELVYSGFFHDPVCQDLEAFLRSTQRLVTGTVTLEAIGGGCTAVAVTSPNMLTRAGASYAQHADWSASDAEGFIKLLGMSSVMAATRSSQSTPQHEVIGIA